MFWMQGEEDGKVDNKFYHYHLKELINSIRLTFNTPQLPFIMGKIHPVDKNCPGTAYNAVSNLAAKFNKIRNIQQNVSCELENVGIIDTASLVCMPNLLYMSNSYPDGIHFNSSSIIELGNKFYNGLLNIGQVNNCTTPDTSKIGSIDTFTSDLHIMELINDPQANSTSLYNMPYDYFDSTTGKNNYFFYNRVLVEQYVEENKYIINKYNSMTNKVKRQAFACDPNAS